LVGEVRQIIGVDRTAEGLRWRSQLPRLPGVVLSEADASDFSSGFGLHVEILATSLVCMRLALEPPSGSAGVYELSDPAYAPVVIVPPILPDHHTPGGARALLAWRAVYSALLRLCLSRHDQTLTTGFHTGLIGYWAGDQREDVNAWVTAYGEFVLELHGHGVHLEDDG
jgi:hypothetical protein